MVEPVELVPRVPTRVFEVEFREMLLDPCPYFTLCLWDFLDQRKADYVATVTGSLYDDPSPIRCLRGYDEWGSCYSRYGHRWRNYKQLSYLPAKIDHRV